MYKNYQDPGDPSCGMQAFMKATNTSMVTEVLES